MNAKTHAAAVDARTPVDFAFGRFAQAAPPQSFFAVSAVFHYLGPAFAVLLFARVEPLGVAWLRIAGAAAVFGVWRRPWRALARLGRSERRTVIAMGATLTVMNCCFYLAIARLPLATVAAIEFLPVIALAAAGARTTRNGAALVAAVAGVYLLTHVRVVGEPLGIVFALANAALFAVYIVLAHDIARGRRVNGVDCLGAAMLVAALVVTPIGGWFAAPAFADPVAVGAGIGVGISSSVIPYVCDQLAMARMRRSTYALFVSLLPATATIVGVVVLAQLPSPGETIGVMLVIGGIALHREAENEPLRPCRPLARGASRARPVERSAGVSGAPNIGGKGSHWHSGALRGGCSPRSSSSPP